jgi:hypothetical protein
MAQRNSALKLGLARWPALLPRAVRPDKTKRCGCADPPAKGVGR